mmetsp:Transcript_42/g.96  ORF Transcript_42/g.96 Transcript_42/m.96 type:complete len:537 (-) Transcript_42:268-1878(-)
MHRPTNRHQTKNTTRPIKYSFKTIANILLLFGLLLYLWVSSSSLALLVRVSSHDHDAAKVISPQSIKRHQLRQTSPQKNARRPKQSFSAHKHPIQVSLGATGTAIKISIDKKRENLYHLFDNLRENENDDGWDDYYDTDDDKKRGEREQHLQEREEFCTRPSFYRLYRPTCNELHSYVSGYDWLFGEEGRRGHSKYLGSGTYRNVFLLKRRITQSTATVGNEKMQSAPNERFDEVIFKTMRQFSRSNREETFEEIIQYDPYEKYRRIELYDDMRKDAMVMELLTSSPRIANLYSFCGMSSLIEYAPGDVEKYVMPTGGYEPTKSPSSGKRDEIVDDIPVNDSIPPREKLEIALEVAKGLATMHGHSDGPIAHVDVQFGQFFRGRDGTIKIIDFNRAEALLYDTEKEKYCPFSNGVPPDGSLRAPEEIIDSPLTEKIDVYSVGNVYYSILTGLLVNHHYDIKQSHHRVKHGQTERISMSFFKSRSAEEFALARVIKWCWTFDANERPSIFQVVEFLENELKINRDVENFPKFLGFDH